MSITYSTEEMKPSGAPVKVIFRLKVKSRTKDLLLFIFTF